jgi:hypothetical protein
MRRLTTRDTLQNFMVEFEKAADQKADIYFTGGATDVLFGWRESNLHKYPAIDPNSFRKAVELMVNKASKG